MSCFSADGKISVRIIYFYYLFFHRRPPHKFWFLSCRPFVVNAKFSTDLEVSSVSWLVQLTVGVWITDYFNYWVSKFLLLLGLSCWYWSSNHWWGEMFVHWVVFSAMTSLSRYLEEAAFSISISSSVFIFLWLFSWCIMDIVSSIVFISWYLKVLIFPKIVI